jgi:hypothetical protein
MLVTVTNGQASIMTSDGVLHQVECELLTDADMVLQARYHQWARSQEYRRSLVCRRCKEAMETETDWNREEDTWEILTVCSCRAMYGKLPCSRLPLPTEN